MGGLAEQKEAFVSKATEDLLYAFDGHDLDGVRAALRAGADACTPVRGKTPVQWLLEQYVRSDRLPDCLRELFARGAVLPDPLLVPVLLDDADGIRAAVAANPTFLQHRTTLVSTFTSLVGVSLLHVAAEYCFANAARALIDAGADVNAPAAINASGLNGHTPIFHTVNSNRNRAEPILQLLLAAGAKADCRIAGLEWGLGYEWETIFFDLTPVSYAQLGLLPQVHRDEQQIWSNVRLLLTAVGRPIPPLPNVPNKYLQPKSVA